MPNPYINQSLLLHASGRVDATAGVLTNQVNISSLVDNGVGNFTINLGTEIDPNDRKIILTPIDGNNSLQVDAATETDGSFTVLVFNPAGAPADLDFDFVVIRVNQPS